MRGRNYRGRRRYRSEILLMKAYRIKDWDYRENAETRKYVDLLWFRNKVKLLGEGLGHTLAAPDGRGPHLYGMFKLIEQIAAGGRLQERGWLFRNGSPMDAARMACLLRLPVALIEEALTFFSTPPLDWIELTDYPTHFPTSGRASGESPTHFPTSGRGVGEFLHPTDRPTDRVLTSDKDREREKKGESSDPREGRQELKDRFAATKSLLRTLEATPEDERTDAEEEEIKKTRRLLNSIQKKQAHGDFTPVKEKAK